MMLICHAFVSCPRCATGKLPEGATKLVALEELYLNDTFLEFLPANFGRLTKLRLLELRENQLATLPKSMTRLTALTRLDLGQNDVTDLPEVVPSIPSLTELWLDGNRLDVLPDSIGSLQVRPRLTPICSLMVARPVLAYRSHSIFSPFASEFGSFGCISQRAARHRPIDRPVQVSRDNSIWARREELVPFVINTNLMDVVSFFLSAHCRSLTDVSLTSNNLTSLPDEIGDLTQLSILRVDDNQLVSLPESIGRLVRLEELQVGHGTHGRILAWSDVDLSVYFSPQGRTESIDQTASFHWTFAEAPHALVGREPAGGTAGRTGLLPSADRSVPQEQSAEPSDARDRPVVQAARHELELQSAVPFARFCPQVTFADCPVVVRSAD